MKGTIELVAGTGLDKNDIAEIRNAIEAALQGTRYEEVFSVTTTREIESDTSIYYLRVSAPFGGTTDNYAGMEHRLQSSLLCHVEFAQSPPSSTACLPRTALPSHEQPRPAASTHGQGRTAGNGPDHPRTPTNTINDFNESRLLTSDILRSMIRDGQVSWRPPFVRTKEP